MIQERYKINIVDRILSLATHDLSQGWIIRTVLILFIYSGILIGNKLGWSDIRTSLTVATSAATIILFFTSPHIRNWILNRHITGYWIYIARSDFGGDDYAKMNIGIPTLVRIYQDNGIIKMIGYHQHTDGEYYFVAKEAALTNPSNNSGRFTYWYQSPASVTGDKSFSGMATLEWQREKVYEPVTRMQGSFCGMGRNHIGFLDYKRINKEEFRQLLSSKI